MAGKSLSELDLKDEQMPALNADDLPDYGAWAPPPQPGPYRFRLPQDLSKVFETYEKTGKTYLRAKFDKDNPLVIVRAATHPEYLNQTFTTQLSNERRKRGDIEASDMDYLLKALMPKGAVLPTSNRAFGEALSQFPGAEFDSDISYSWACSETRDIYVAKKDDAGNATGDTEKLEGTKGCGAKYYQKEKTKKPEQQIDKVNGEYPYEIACRCGAIVRAFANLDNIRK
jgi:hypothetical protein